jgi:hypothetical protein
MSNPPPPSPAPENPLPPGVSPLLPVSVKKRRRYSDEIIKEAMKLAREVSVAFAVKYTGVDKYVLYTALNPTPYQKARKRAAAWKLRKETPAQKMAKLPAFKEAIRLGEYYYANVRHNNIGKKICMERGARMCGLDPKVFIRAWEKQLYIK